MLDTSSSICVVEKRERDAKGQGIRGKKKRWNPFPCQARLPLWGNWSWEIVTWGHSRVGSLSPGPHQVPGVGDRRAERVTVKRDGQGRAPWPQPTPDILPWPEWAWKGSRHRTIGKGLKTTGVWWIKPRGCPVMQFMGDKKNKEKEKNK